MNASPYLPSNFLRQKKAKANMVDPALYSDPNSYAMKSGRYEQYRNFAVAQNADLIQRATGQIPQSNGATLAANDALRSVYRPARIYPPNKRN